MVALSLEIQKKNCPSVNVPVGQSCIPGLEELRACVSDVLCIELAGDCEPGPCLVRRRAGLSLSTDLETQVLAPRLSSRGQHVEGGHRQHK